MTRLILTADQMRAAEQAAIDAGSSVEQLMERAGAALAEAVYRFAGPLPVLILCGPGNNGGDRYCPAPPLADCRVPVPLAARAQPKSNGAISARPHCGSITTHLYTGSKRVPVSYHGALATTRQDALS